MMLLISVGGEFIYLMLLLVSPPDNYEVVRKIGRGKYSEVFEGINISNGSNLNPPI